MSGVEVVGGIGGIGLSTLIIWVFRSGSFAERLQSAQERAKKDSDGIARLVRDEIARSERNWLHEIADRAEELYPRDRAHRLAHRIREKAWRI